MGWQEDWGFVGGSGERDLGPIEWIEGAGHRRAYTNSEGKRVYRALTPAEQQATGKTPTGDETRITRETGRKDEAAAIERSNLLQAESNRRADQNHAAVMEGLKNQQTSILGQLEHSRDALLATTRSQDADRNQRGDQFNANIALQTKQIEANNTLLKERMGLEDKHFQQKMAYDQKMGRRAQIISSLSLVAQSLSRL